MENGFGKNREPSVENALDAPSDTGNQVFL